MPEVVIVPPKIDVPPTTKLDVPVVLVMLLPLAIVKFPTLKPVCRSRADEPVIVRLPAASPKLPVLVTTTVPALIVVPPVYVLAPDKVKLPALTTKLPKAPLITPAYSPEVFDKVSTLPPNTKLLELLPVKLVIVAPVVVPLMSNVALFTTPLDAAILPLPVKLKVPALIVVKPVYELAPLKVNVPAPTFVSNN